VEGEEEEDVAAGAAASDTTAQSATIMTGTGLNNAKDTNAITGAITMAVYTTPLHTITTMITTKPPATNTVEIAFMIITTRDVIVIRSDLKISSLSSKTGKNSFKGALKLEVPKMS
jgi:hypothetical protein